jgi:Transglycosylase SLT domain
MRKILLAFMLILATGCTQYQISWHQNLLGSIAQETDPAKKQELQSYYDYVVANYQAFHDEATAGHPCEQFFDLAMEAGFTIEQWKNPMSRIMNAESGCSPSAYNRSGATGLMQIMKMWADDCGGTPADLFDPVFNINCAFHVWQVQGWPAWSTY